MANIPTPRSFNQILGDMMDAFLSRLGLRGIRPGSPVLALFEAAGQSDLRSSQDIFDMVNSTSLDRATGVTLDRIGADEDLPRLTESPSSGSVTISDTSFVKKSTKIYQGQPAPIVGSASVYVIDANSFPASGSIYIGRGTSNYEGPLAYSAKVNAGTYWTLTLTDNTKKFHNLGETVVLAQGGNRVISAGTMVQTPQGNANDAVQFSVLYTATVPDGETSIEAIVVTARKPGTIGNVSSKAINAFVTSPFTGAAVNNPLPYSNGTAAESDKDYRERIRAVRQSRAKGTALAIQVSVEGITATDENKRVTSSSIVTRQGFPTTLYIDDGTGYEERSSGIAIEPLLDRASSGEQYFQVSAAKPVTKASLTTTLKAPFKLRAASQLALKIGGVTQAHTFNSTAFRNIENATAYEVAASINGDSTISFSAATAEAGTKVKVFSKADTNEDVEIVTPSGTDANLDLLFPAGRVDTMRLYKNDRLLSKDGKIASLTSKPVAQWGVLTSGETLTLAVDKTAPITHTFIDQDFVDAKTGFTTVARNTVAAWVAVINAKIPGITATETAGLISLSSNVGASSRAKLDITAGTLVTKQVFAAGSDTGFDRDYTLDRNTGQIRLETVLSLNDTLAAGSVHTRAFIESQTLATTEIVAPGAVLHFVVDGAAKIIPTGLTAGALISVSEYVANPVIGWYKRVRYTASAGTPFVNVLVGDWVIVQDSGFASALNRGMWRVALATSTYFEVEKATTSFAAETDRALAVSDGIVFVRTPAQLQRVTIPTATNYTAANFVTELNLDLIGAKASVYQTSKIRIRTNSFTGGDVALVASDIEGKKLKLPLADAVVNVIPHLASIESGNRETGTPVFANNFVTSVASASIVTLNDTTGLTLDKWMALTKLFPDPDSGTAGGYRSIWGSLAGRTSQLTDVTGSVVTIRTSVSPQEFVPTDPLYLASPYSIGPQNDLVVVADLDEVGKRFQIPLWRKLKPSGSTYALTNAFKDADNSNSSLNVAFGQTFDFTDFALYMAARIKTHDADATKRLLWRYKRLGPDGDNARIRYVYPDKASTALSVAVDTLTTGTTDISVKIGSGALKDSTSNFRTTTKIGLSCTPQGGGDQRELLTYILGYSVTSAVREIRLDYNTKTAGWTVGETVTGVTSTAVGTIASVVGGAPGGATGTIVLTGVTGTFGINEFLTGSVSGASVAKATAAQYGHTTLTLGMPPGITAHGFLVGNNLYLNSSSGSFSSGVKAVTSIAATTFTYTDSVATTQAATPDIGTISYDTGEVTLAGVAPPVAVGDILQVEATAGFTTASFKPQTLRISALGNQYMQGYMDTGPAAQATPLWEPLAVPAAIRIFPLTSNTATAIAASINALDAKCPVKATVTGSGGGSISLSSSDELAVAGSWFGLVDGVNWILSITYPPLPPPSTNDYQFTFKKPITASLASDSDWINEDVRCVPLSAKAIARWLNSQAVSGISSACLVETSSNATKVQVASLKSGSAGAIQVQGGSANSGAAAVNGAAALAAAGVYSVVTVPKSDSETFYAGMWMAADNTQGMPKTTLTGTTRVVSIATNGAVVVSITPVYTFANVALAPILAKTWRTEKQGRFIAYTYSKSTYGALPSGNHDLGIEEGDWVRIQNLTMSSLNAGIFRVVRVHTNADAFSFWIENPNAVEGDGTADVAFYEYNSLMPGDTISISTAIFGAANQGIWTVEFVGGLTSGTAFTDPQTFKLSVADKAPVAFVDGMGGLTFDPALVKAIEARPSRLIKQIRTISQNQTSLDFLDLKLESSAGSGLLSNTAGTILTPLDRLGFSADIKVGIDGYQHSTGLIGEANRVVYGDSRDSATYPGVVAAGANINISGPLVKRVTVALSLRIRSGVSRVDIADRVKSAVASVINSAGVGVAISISDLVAAASKVSGVVAVAILSPSYSATSDLISVQPFEKPLVLNLDQDVTISFAGE